MLRADPRDSFGEFRRAVQAREPAGDACITARDALPRDPALRVSTPPFAADANRSRLSSKFSPCRQQQRSRTITIEERKRFLEVRGRDFEENFVLDRSFLLPLNRSEVPQSSSSSSSSSSSILLARLSHGLGRSDPRPRYQSPLGLSENVNRKSSGSAQQVSAYGSASPSEVPDARGRVSRIESKIPGLRRARVPGR